METPTILVLSGLTIAAAEVIKKTELVPHPKRFMPVVSFGLGLGLSIAFKLPVLEGLMVGAAASGTYDIVKKSVLGK